MDVEVAGHPIGIDVQLHGSLHGPGKAMGEPADGEIFTVGPDELTVGTVPRALRSYRHPGGSGAANLLADMDRSPLRYLTPDERDFFAVYLR
jgi:hypothetical protein